MIDLTIHTNLTAYQVLKGIYGTAVKGHKKKMSFSDGPITGD